VGGQKSATLYREWSHTSVIGEKGSMCTGGDPGGGSEKEEKKKKEEEPIVVKPAKPKAAPNMGAAKSSQKPSGKTTPKPNASYFGDLGSKPKPKASPSPAPRPKSTPSGGGASRKAAPTGEEFRAKRAPGQGDVKLPGDRRGRPKEPGGVDDRDPGPKTRPQAAYDSIQELRGRLDKQPPGLIGGIGRISLKKQIKDLQSGSLPVMADGLTVGTISRTGSYTGRSEFGDFARQNYRDLFAEGNTSPGLTTTAREQNRIAQERNERDPDPAPRKEPSPEVSDEVAVENFGGPLSSTKQRRSSGRRTAFGTRRSLLGNIR